jgi:MFS superfamily sulfate permease-like transporter
LNKSTGGQFGVPETIAATGAMGLLYSIFAGQGLVIIGVTGPVVFYVNTIVSLSNAIDAPFMQMMLWACFWCGLMHVAVAASGATVLVKRVTSFSGECFGFFIATAYIYLGLKGIMQTFWRVTDDDDDVDAKTDSPAARRGAAFAKLALALLTYKLAISFHHARSWTIFQEYGRDVVAQFGMVAAIFTCTALSYTPVFDDGYVEVARLEVSGNFGKNIPIPLMGGDMKVWQVFFAIIPATMLLVLFFFDHNVSSLLSQQKRFQLEKPPSYHYDFAVLGTIFALCGFFGVPPGNGLIPQAPLHVRALATIENIDGKEVYRKVEEKRWSNFLQSALCLVTLLIMPIISMIPHAVLSGTFLYMGVSGLGDNGLFDRACGMLMEPALRPALWSGGTEKPDWAQQVTRYTLTQLACVTVIFIISLNCFLGLNGPPISIAFPFFIAALVPIREKILPKFLSEEELEILDPFDPTEED